MSDRYKILAQSSLNQVDPGPGLTKLYSVPVASGTTVGTVTGVAPLSTSIHVQTMVTSLIVCNTSAVDGSFSIQIIGWDPEESVATDSSYLFKDAPLIQATTKALSLGLVLSPGEELKTAIGVVVSPSHFECDFTLMGIEVVSGGGPNG